ncbi:hypothetical protein C8A03DRAFT_35073 [Achaetomium macrosporum]|uniref:Uncharacterized protein n=1 Tax=Achaetomium macrosporum TaxID=79813 RepID=A0AAN7C8M2_9PEZI|nr:hypothetical protein C8A03DRAFT_35073 [Achaetomium macrosporum]
MAAPLSPDSAPFPPLKWPGHRYEAVEIECEAEKDHSSSPGANSDQSCHPPNNEPAAGSIENANWPWRPFYLRRRVLLFFAAVFAIIIIAIEGLVAVSEKNNGIVSASSNLHYLWTYGPTALLTLIAAVWSRTEYQSKLVAPWIRLSKQPAHPKHTLLLDYLSEFQLYAVFKALRNRDFLVSIASAVAIVIKVMIVISTGLISLSWTLVDHASFPMIVQDRFVDNGARLATTGNLAYYIMQGLMDRNLTYPNGMSETFAFQSVQAELPDTAETRVVVDGFQSSLDCWPADVALRGSAPGDPHYAESTMNLTITSPDCNVKDLRLYPGPDGDCFRDGADSCTFLFGRFTQIQCDGTADDSGRRVLVMFGNMTYVVDRSTVEKDYTGQLRKHPYLATLHRSTQMLCLPTYAITEVEVVRNGTRTRSVTRSPGVGNRTLDSVTGWKMMDAHYAAFAGIGSTGAAYPRSVNVSGTIVDVDPYMQIALPSQLDTDEQLPSLLDPQPLRELATRYYRQFTAIVAKQALVESVSIETHGSVVLYGYRLVMRTWASQWMAGLAACCLVLVTIGIFLVPKRGILPHSPTTLPGMASLVAQSHDLLASLRFSGAADAASLARPLTALRFQSGVVSDPVSNKPQFAILSAQELLDRSSTMFPQISSKHMHPGVLHPASRLALCLVLTGLIISLELTLRKSNRENGLGDVGDDDTYIHYAWTAVPAFVFGVVAMTISSMDFQVRSLAPYTALKHTIDAKTFMTIDFMDMSVPRTMFNEIRFANIGALAATAAFLVSSVFAIASSSLFQPVAFPMVLPTTLRANMSFDLDPYGNQEAASIASLILESNLSYPRFTYGDLAFPQLVPSVSLPHDRSVNASTISINAEVPAVRAKLTCRIYDASKIQTNHTLNYTIKYSSYQNPLGIYIQGEECNRFPKYEDAKYNNILATYPNMTYFGLGDETQNVTAVQGCSQLLYTWGKLNFSATPIVQHIAAVGCNQTAETVVVNTTFVGTALDIDSRNLPQPLENTTRPTTLRPSASLIYSYLASINTAPEMLDPFFQMLTSSPWAIPLSSLGDPAAVDTITASIKRHHGIISAQTFAQQLLPANSSNATLPASVLDANPNATDDAVTYTGTATTEAGEAERRVVQDTTSTRILQALLAATVALVALGWACMHETDVLPRTPTTIASVVALLAGGNLFEVHEAEAGGLGGDDKDGGEKKGGGWIWDSVGIRENGGGGGGKAGGGEGGQEEEKGNTGLGDLERARFWMGWGTVPDWEGREDGGGENEGGVSRFGIFVVWDKEEGGKEKDGHGALMGGE